MILRHLIWDSDKECVDEILKNCGISDLDMIIGADVMYSENGISSLFKLSRMMLSGKCSRLLLCFMVRSVGEKDILSTALAHGFELCQFESQFLASIDRIRKKFNIPIKFLCLAPIIK